MVIDVGGGDEDSGGNDDDGGGVFIVGNLLSGTKPDGCLGSELILGRERKEVVDDVDD